MVFRDAAILAGPSVEAVADAQDGGEQRAGEPVTEFDGQCDRLCAEEGPCQEPVTWSGTSYNSTVEPAQC